MTLKSFTGGLLRCSLPAWGLLLSLAAGAAQDGGRTFYRYLNSEGVRVISHQIPPEYAQKGYEVVTASGQVLKVVDPAPTPEEAAALERQREIKEALREWDEELLRRYSSVRDIEATKQRKLAQVQTSIEILKSNISNLKSQIVVQHAKAANVERAGRDVPKQILTSLANLEQELSLSQQQLEQRRQQYREVVEKYNNDKERFSAIRPEGP